MIREKSFISFLKESPIDDLVKQETISRSVLEGTDAGTFE
jgi:hypothetical protein